LAAAHSADHAGPGLDLAICRAIPSAGPEQDFSGDWQGIGRGLRLGAIFMESVMPATGTPDATRTVLAAVASPAWKTRGISRRGAQARYRVNTALGHANDISLYPVRIEVAVPLRQPSFNGLPTAAEQRRLAGIEETLLGAVAARAVLAGVLTSVGVCHFVFYAATADWVQEIGPALQPVAGRTSVQVTPDPAWQTFRKLLRAARRTNTIGIAALCLAPFIDGVLAGSAYGAAWGIAAFAAPLVLTAMFFPFRRQGPHWYLAHSVVMSSLFAALLGAILFGVVAHLGRALSLPAWGSALASLVIGAGLVAAVWPAQRRFWRARQEPAADAAAGQG
jgi:Family of unknown function (DUF695)